MEKAMRFGAVIVETRSLPNLVDIINQHMDFLPGAGLTIFGFDNVQQLVKAFPKANIINLGSHLNEQQYNYLLTSSFFWKCLPYDKVLIFQHDSVILRDGIKDFLGWDYIGAPWKFPPYVGNGGFSIRSVPAMLRTIEKVKYNHAIHGNEDVYFCNHLQGILAPIEVAEKFCVESIYKLSTFAYHAIEKYLTQEQVLTIKKQYQ